MSASKMSNPSKRINRLAVPKRDLQFAEDPIQKLGDFRGLLLADCPIAMSNCFKPAEVQELLTATRAVYTPAAMKPPKVPKPLLSSQIVRKLKETSVQEFSSNKVPSRCCQQEPIEVVRPSRSEALLVHTDIQSFEKKLS